MGVSRNFSIEQAARPVFDRRLIMTGGRVAQAGMQVFVDQGEALLVRFQAARMDAVPVLSRERRTVSEQANARRGRRLETRQMLLQDAMPARGACEPVFGDGEAPAGDARRIVRRARTDSGKGAAQDDIPRLPGAAIHMAVRISVAACLAMTVFSRIRSPAHEIAHFV
jgi:hypothetical protein